MRDQVVEFVLQFLEESKVQVLSRAHSNGEELERAKQFGALLIGKELNQVDALLAGDLDVGDDRFRGDLANDLAGVVLGDFWRVCIFVVFANLEIVSNISVLFGAKKS